MSDPNYVKRPGGRPPKYPWDQWLDGVDKILILRTSAVVKDAPPVYYYDPPKVIGEKVLRPAAIMQKQILNTARKREIMVSTEQLPSEAIGVRFLGSSRREVASQPQRELTEDEKFDRLLDGTCYEVPVRKMTRAEFEDLVHEQAAKRGLTVTIERDLPDLEDGTIVVGVQALPAQTDESDLYSEAGEQRPPSPAAGSSPAAERPAEPLIRAVDRSES